MSLLRRAPSKCSTSRRTQATERGPELGSLPVTFEIDVTDRGVMVRYRGSVSFEGISAAAHAMAVHPDFRPDLPTVWDFSVVESLSGLGADDMRRLASVVTPFRRGGGRPRVALVTPDDANFAGARMFNGLNEARLLIDLRVFRDAAEARDWAFGPISDHEGHDEGGAS